MLFNYAIAKLVALNLFASFFVSDFDIDLCLLLCIALRIFIALPTIAILIVFFNLKGDSEKERKTYHFKSKKSNNYCNGRKREITERRKENIQKK